MAKLDQSKPTGPKNALSQTVKSEAPHKSGPKIKITPPLAPLPSQTSKSLKDIPENSNNKVTTPKITHGTEICFNKKGRC